MVLSTPVVSPGARHLSTGLTVLAAALAGGIVDRLERATAELAQGQEEMALGPTH